MLPLNLPGVPIGLLLDQGATIGQGPTVTPVNVPCSLRAFTDGRGLGIKEITRMMKSITMYNLISEAHSKEISNNGLLALKATKWLSKKGLLIGGLNLGERVFNTRNVPRSTVPRKGKEPLLVFVR